MRKRTVLQYLSLTDFLDHSLSAYVKASLGEKLIVRITTRCCVSSFRPPRGEAVMIGGTPKTPRRRPGGVQRRQELGPAALQKTGLRVGCFAVAVKSPAAWLPREPVAPGARTLGTEGARGHWASIFNRSAPEVILYHHVQKLMYTVRVDEPDPRFGNMLHEQFGGANGELAAAMQYSIQGLNCEDPDRKDLLMDIGTEELSHLEIVGTLARMHLKPMKFDRQAAEADPLIAICGGGGVALHNSQGNPWTADYLKITGELDVDLRSNIAAEARAKIVYERLINFCDDPGTKDALQFLMTREITHLRAFMAALDSMGKDPLSIGNLPPSAEY